MTIVQTAIDVVQAAGGVGAVAIIIRGGYRHLTKSGREKGAVEVTLALLKGADDQASRLNTRLAEAEDRADRLSARIKELEAESLIRARENATLTREIAEVRAQLVEAQLEAARLRGLLEMGEGS